MKLNSAVFDTFFLFIENYALSRMGISTVRMDNTY